MCGLSRSLEISAFIVSIALMTTSSSATTGPGTSHLVEFRAAFIALDQGDLQVAADLIVQACDGQMTADDARVCEALMAKAEERPSDVARIVDSFPSDPDPDAFSSPAFFDALIRLAAERRLEVARERSAAALRSLLERHYQARGGLDALLSLDDLMAHGRLSTGQRESAFVMARKRPSHYRLDVLTPEGVRIQATDGDTAWQVDPEVRNGAVVELSGIAAQRLNRQAQFDDVLIRYPTSGERLSARGVEVIDGSNAYRIDIEVPNGDRQAIFLDAVTFLEVQRLIWTEPDGPPIVMTFEHQKVDGIALPSRQTIRTPTVTLEYLFEHYEIGRPLDSELFDPAHGGRLSLLHDEHRTKDAPIRN